MTSFPDGGELGELLAQMQHLQESVQQAEATASAQSVEGSAAGGAVRIRASGEFSFDAVVIEPSVVDPSDVALLEDLVLAAARDAVAKLTTIRRAAMGDAVQGALAQLLGDVADDDDDDDDETDDEDDDEAAGPDEPGLSR